MKFLCDRPLCFHVSIEIDERNDCFRFLYFYFAKTGVWMVDQKRSLQVGNR